MLEHRFFNKLLEKRLANFLQCEAGDLPRFKIGTLINTLFCSSATPTNWAGTSHRWMGH
jgi:hypothetical protein